MLEVSPSHILRWVNHPGILKTLLQQVWGGASAAFPRRTRCFRAAGPQTPLRATSQGRSPSGSVKGISSSSPPSPGCCLKDSRCCVSVRALGVRCKCLCFGQITDDVNEPGDLVQAFSPAQDLRHSSGPVKRG